MSAGAVGMRHTPSASLIAATLATRRG
jgi:hypothetical protein